LHRSRAELLKPLNAAISRLREDGTLAKITQRYAAPLGREAVGSTLSGSKEIQGPVVSAD
jgi:hypothetical protein